MVGRGFFGGTVVSAVVGGLIVLHGPTVHLKLQVFAFAGHFKVHLPPVQLALQCSPLQSKSHPPLVHDKSHVFAVHRTGLQLPPVHVMSHLSDEWQVKEQLPPVQICSHLLKLELLGHVKLQPPWTHF